jgi:predicted O-linked N-acetylglucosamine transferase (SPINDLY family)
MEATSEMLVRARKHYQAGDLVNAEQIYRQILQVDPGHAHTWYLLGTVCQMRGNLDEALGALRQALQLKPTFAESHNHLGVALAQQRKLDDAITSFREALLLKPELASAHRNLALALMERWKLDEAVGSLQQAIKHKPDFAQAHYDLGIAYVRQGRPEEAVNSFRQAVLLKPNNAKAHSAMLLTLHYLAQSEPPSLFAEHCRWADQHAAGLAPPHPPRSANRDPKRTLRIGYVSPDFREHAVARYVEPVFAAHDHSLFHITAYADVDQPDAVTAGIQAHADQWRRIAGSRDREVARLIRQDEIDILVDLAGHTGMNRLLVFACKPAPIQVTHFGYPNTTGLRTVDYRITDLYADPPGKSEGFYTEKLIRLPETAWCYQPSPGPEVAPLPCLKSGQVTFGSFNNLPKVTSEVIALWSRILKALPLSRLRILTNSSAQGEQRAMDTFARNGIRGDRIDLVGRKRRDEYFQLYQGVDICLDPFPYNGGITTCDALWMGVPVISLEGNSYVSRQGVSLLSNLGMQELIAESPEAYVEKAVRLCDDLPRLREIRPTLRKRMEQSPVMDARRFVRNLEEAYRQMWRDWLASSA